jgi:5'-phosphate synthase pdxT subunit
VKIGVIGLQGDVEEHIEAFRNLAETIRITGPQQLQTVDALVIPGGESTTIGKLLVSTGLFDRVREMGLAGLPILGTCAGMVLLAKKGDEIVERTKQPLLGLMDFAVKRNAFGRQRESFETDLEIPVLGPRPFRCVFIRAPVATEVWGRAEILATFQDKIVAVQQDAMLALSFHPELVPEDDRMLRYFVELCKR